MVELYLETTSTLENLSIEGIMPLDEECVACLLRGLRFHFPQQHHTLSFTKLSFIGLTLTREAADCFVDFMQAPVEIYSTDKSHSLRELSISSWFGSYTTGSRISNFVDSTQQN